MGEARERLAESLAAMREVFRNPGLRRVELAWAASVTSNWSYLIALAVFAYDAGGAAAVGAVAVIRLIPSAFAAPFTALLGDRYRRDRVMLASVLLRGLAMAGAAVAVFLDAPAPAVYALAGFMSLMSTTFRPAQAAVLPQLARTPQELTAANVTAATIDSIGSLLGPALGGLLLAATSTEVVFAATAALLFVAAVLVGRIHTEVPAREPGAGVGLAAEILAGFRAIGGERDLRLVVGLYAAQTLVAGALNVLVVVVALDLLDLGEAGVGFLNSAVGVGGLAGAVTAIALVGRKRLAGDFALGIVLWGVPLALIGVWPNATVALLMLGLVGIGNTLVDVAALTLLQRTVSDDVLARVFGALESLLVGTLGLGAVAAPIMIETIGIRWALIVTGALLPVLAALAWRRLAGIDAAAPARLRELALLRAIPIFAPLPGPTLEHLASRLATLRLRAGEQIVRQGDRGDRFYIVAAGEVEVLGGRLGEGGYFGEIALLRDVPRTATVTAAADVELLALDRDDFLAAVTGHAESAQAAEGVVGARLRAATI